MASDETKARRMAFVLKLFDHVRRNALNWEETANPTTFQVVLDSFVVQIDKTYDDDIGETFVGISLLNNAGARLEVLYPGLFDRGAFFDEAGDSPSGAFDVMYESARRRALNVDTALELATKELDEHVPF